MDHVSRRNFLKSSALAATPAAAAPAEGSTSAAPAPAPPEYRQSEFAPTAAPRRISENLYLFEDTCNVFIVREGGSCVLIDFGSGKVLDHLQALGIHKVDWILHTHHHRDQCQGDGKAAARGIPIAVPAHERYLFADAENFWRNRRIFHLYYMRNDFYTVTQNIPVARSLPDYSTFRWGKYEFFILPTPGHTLGSISLLADIDGKRTAFTGDLMYAPGKIQTLYDTQIAYGGTEGIDLAAFSLQHLSERKPEFLCPSHGQVLADPEPGIRQTMRRLSEYYHFQTGGQPMIEYKPYALSPHLVANYDTMSSFYVVLSDSGKALFVDYGSPGGGMFFAMERATGVYDRIRFIEHNLGILRDTYGMKSIDVAMPSHMHDDHMNGFPHLVRNFGTKIWCYENMVDIFERPRGYNLGCILAEPMKIDRAFRHGEKFRWEEFEFEVTHSPGHTEYQMALFANIDGNRVAFTADAFFSNPRNDGTLRHNLIFRNHVENDSHLKSIENLIEHDPNIICPGHGRPFPVDRPMMTATLDKFRKQQQWFFDLLPEGETDFGLDPSWVKIYPYQLLLTPDKATPAKVIVQNYKAEPLRMEIALITPKEWVVEPNLVRFEVPARSTAERSFTIRVPGSWQAPGPRLAIAADVVRNGRYLGQITEAVADLVS
jgi:glyoxylase-like metal-dependent hydrolase (beta-lactamase superfamily II)